MRHVCVVLLGLLVGGPVVAQEMGPQPEEPTGPIAQATGMLTGLDGTLTDVDAGRSTITVARHNGTEQFRLSGATEVLIDAEPSTPDRLAVDQKVRVYYIKAGNPPYLANQILDAATIAVLDAEREGVAATIEAIQQAGEGDDQTTVVVVTTSQGKRRELVVRREGGWASTVMKDGRAAGLDAFAAGEAVMISVRRTSGARLYLKGLADTPTFLAFLALRTLRGKVAEVADDGTTLRLTIDGQAEPTTVRLTRRTTFFRGGQAAEKDPFGAGDEVLVKFATTEKGVVVARALFAPDSWQAYAASLAEQPAAATPAAP